MPIFQPCDPVWFTEAGTFLDACSLLVLLMAKADCYGAYIYRIVLPKTHAADNTTPHFPPDQS